MHAHFVLPTFMLSSNTSDWSNIVCFVDASEESTVLTVLASLYDKQTIALKRLSGRQETGNCTHKIQGHVSSQQPDRDGLQEIHTMHTETVHRIGRDSAQIDTKERLLRWADQWDMSRRVIST